MTTGYITVAQLRAQRARVLSKLEHLDDSIEALLAHERRVARGEKVRPLEEVVVTRVRHRREIYRKLR